jgi:hypothetical protein
MTLSSNLRKPIDCILFLFAIGGGFIFYSHGYLSPEMGLGNALSAGLRAIFSTTRMFLVNADYEVLSTISTGWKAVFWTCHISALILFQRALFTLFGRKLVEIFRIYLGRHNEVYIIKGNDKNAFMLGENIATNDKQKNKIINNKFGLWLLKKFRIDTEIYLNNNRLVMFLSDDNDDLKKMQEKIASFNGIIKVLNGKYNIEYYLEMTGLGSGVENGVLGFIKKALNFIRPKFIWPEKEYYVILMPNSSSVSKDADCVVKYAKDKNVKPEKLNMFVFVSSEWDREQIESLTKKGSPCVFHIICETDLLTRQMVKKYSPFKSSGLGFNESGEATRSFNVMILGFGVIGEQALLRLIMNGQFVTQGERKLMRAVVIDKDRQHVEEHFRHCYPSLNLCCEIVFLDYDVRNKKFYDLLNLDCDENGKRVVDIVSNLDYIVIALNNNEENKKIARDIQLHYERKNTEHPFIAIFEKNAVMDETRDDKTFTFGCQEDIYKHSVVIREEIDRRAKAVNEVYKEEYGGQSWHKLSWIKQESNRASADFISIMLELAGEITEGKAIEMAINNEPLVQENSEISNILAQTEHLRWNAFHVAMGYSPITIEKMQERFDYGKSKGKKGLDLLKFCRQDEEYRLHACLVNWNNLDEVSKVYNELARKAYNELVREKGIKLTCNEDKKNIEKVEKEQRRDFKNNDRSIVTNIPKFLKKNEDKNV